jgi:hypothetical protein
LEVTVRKQCAVCQVPFEAQRAAAKYCSPRCRVRATRARSAGQGDSAGGVAVPLPAVPAGVEAAVGVELAAAGRTATSAGQSALALARRIDGGAGEPASGLAAMVRELRATLADAVKDGQSVANPLDELRARRERSRVAG